jgi:hypothetical protein
MHFCTSFNAFSLCFSRIDERSSFKAKLDTTAVLSASFSQKLSPGVGMTVCAEVDVSEWSADSHKFGFVLNFDL